MKYRQDVPSTHSPLIFLNLYQTQVVSLLRQVFSRPFCNIPVLTCSRYAPRPMLKRSTFLPHFAPTATLFFLSLHFISFYSFLSHVRADSCLPCCIAAGLHPATSHFNQIVTTLSHDPACFRLTHSQSPHNAASLFRRQNHFNTIVFSRSPPCTPPPCLHSLPCGNSSLTSSVHVHLLHALFLLESPVVGCGSSSRSIPAQDELQLPSVSSIALGAANLSQVAAHHRQRSGCNALLCG